MKFFKRRADGAFAADGTMPIPGGSAPSGLDAQRGRQPPVRGAEHEHQVAVIDTPTRTVLGQSPGRHLSVHDGAVSRRVEGLRQQLGRQVPGPADFTDGMFPVVVDPAHRHPDQRHGLGDRHRQQHGRRRRSTSACIRAAWP